MSVAQHFVTSPREKVTNTQTPPWFANTKVYSLLHLVEKRETENEKWFHPFSYTEKDKTSWRERERERTNTDLSIIFLIFSYSSRTYLPGVLYSPLASGIRLFLFLYSILRPLPLLFHLSFSPPITTSGRFATDTFLFLTWRSAAIAILDLENL